MDMSGHGLSHPFKSPGVVAHCLTDIKNELVKCLLVCRRLIPQHF